MQIKSKLIIAFYLLVLGSCESTLDYEPPTSKQIVIFGLFEVGGNGTIIIDQAAAIGKEKQPNRVCNAEASISLNGVVKILEPSEKYGGCALTSKDYNLRPGLSYKTEIKVNGQTINKVFKTVDTSFFNLKIIDKPILTYETQTSISGKSIGYQQNIIIDQIIGANQNTFISVELVDTAGGTSFKSVNLAEIKGTTFKKLEDNIFFLSSYLFKVPLDQELDLSLSYVSSEKKVKGFIKINMIKFDDDILKYIRKSQSIRETISDPFLVPVTSFSNIENGIGVIGSYSNFSKIISVELP